MKDTVQDFMKTPVRKYNRGYAVYLSEAPEYAAEAVIDDLDDKKTLLDLSNEKWDDDEDMADTAVEIYELRKIAEREPANHFIQHIQDVLNAVTSEFFNASTKKKPYVVKTSTINGFIDKIINDRGEYLDNVIVDLNETLFELITYIETESGIGGDKND